MPVTVLLLMVRGARPLSTRYSGKITSNRLFNSAFDDIPEMDLFMYTFHFICALFNGPPQCGHTGVYLSARPFAIFHPLLVHARHPPQSLEKSPDACACAM